MREFCLATASSALVPHVAQMNDAQMNDAQMNRRRSAQVR